MRRDRWPQYRCVQKQVAVIVSATCLLVGCSHAGSASDPALPRTAATSSTSVSTASDQPVTSAARLARVDPIGTQTVRRVPARPEDTGTNRPVNEIGQPYELDGPGARTCALAELAFRAPELKRDPKPLMAAMRSAVRTSNVKPLAHAVSVVAMDGKPSVRSVLEMCVTLGYEL